MKLAHSSAQSSLCTLHSIEIYVLFCFILQQSKNFDILKLVIFLENRETVQSLILENRFIPF